IFYPAAGDGPEVIAQKAAARKQAIGAFQLAAGPLAAQAASTVQKPADAPREMGPEDQAKFFQILKSEGPDKADEYLRGFGMQMKDKSAADKPYSEKLEPAKGDFANSYLGQGLSGANEGLADVLGAPADLATAALNLVPKGVNFLANTNI